MSKGKSTKRDSKKEPLMTAKEKKQAKQVKKSNASGINLKTK